MMLRMRAKKMSNRTYSKKYYSLKQEKLVAETLGWRVVSGSGARPNCPGDVESADWLGECKTHEAAGHKIVFNSSVWDKICEEADSRFKFPALFVDDGSQTKKNTWVMFRILPTGEYHLTRYPYPIKKNVLFDSLSMREHHRSVSDDCSSFVVYSLSADSSLRFIASLEDFAQLFFPEVR